MVKIVTNVILFFFEYLFKLTSGVAGLIVLGAPGSFYEKLSSGYGSLLPVFRQIIEFPENIAYTTAVINDYNTLTAAHFNQRYGAQAVNHVMESMNESVLYSQAVYQNLAHQPIITVLAVLVAFLSLYILGRCICFIRQKGQGSFFTRLERRLGNRFFNDVPG